MVDDVSQSAEIADTGSKDEQPRDDHDRTYRPGEPPHEDGRVRSRERYGHEHFSHVG